MKFSETFCKCAICTGAITPPSNDDDYDRRMAWWSPFLMIGLSAILWATLAWAFTGIWMSW